MRLPELAHVLHVACPEDIPIQGITIDSRRITLGDLFVAIPGEHFDGHDFALSAQENGASAIVCTHPIEGLSIPQLLVNDTVIALGQLATYHRQQFDIPTIALTGSNGKTSVKEMIYAMLPQPSLANAGNYNNHIGAPLSLLRLNDTHVAAVFELGANHVGEIAYTSKLIHPDVALINNIAPAHIGEFGSIEAIAHTKGEIFDALTPSGTAVLNDDDEYAHFWDDKLRDHPVLRFSRLHRADVFAEAIVLDEHGRPSFDLHLPDLPAHRVTLQVSGLHNVSNALAAAACCHALNIEASQIYHGLQQFQGVSGRLMFKKGQNASLVIDDTYNANLRSVLAAIEVLAQQSGQKILVLGNMGELGDYTQAHHEAAGKAAKDQGIHRLFTFGDAAEHASKAFGKGAIHCQTQAHIIEHIRPLLDANTTVLVKGSRSAAMEHIVAALIQQQ